MSKISTEQLNIIDVIPLPIAINDDNLNILYLNKEFIRFFGYTLDEIPHLDVWWPKAYPDESYRKWIADNWIKRLETARETNQIFDPMEAKISCKDNSYKYVLISPAPMQLSLADTHLVIFTDITEQKLTNQKLMQSTNLLQTIVNTLPMKIFWKDIHSTYLGANENLAKDAGKNTAEELIGLNDYQLAWQEYAEQYRKDDRYVMDTGQTKLDIVEPFVDNHHHTAWIKTSKSPLIDDENNIFGVLGIFEDITQQRALQAFEQLRNQVLEKLTTNHKIDQIFSLIFDTLGYLFPNLTLIIDFVDSHGLFPKQRYQSSILEQLHNVQILKPDIYLELAKNKESLIIKDISKKHHSDDFVKISQSLPIKTYYSQTLLNQSKLTAMIYFLSKTEICFSELETQIIENFVSLITISVQRKIADERLNLADIVFQNTSEAIMITDHKHNIISVNPAFCQITDYQLNEVIGKNPRIINSGRMSKEFYQSMFSELEECGSWAGEIWNQRKNGVIIPEWVSISTIYDNNHSPVYYIAMYKDLSEKKQSDQIIWNQANYDNLTNLPNRRLFSDRLTQEIKRCQRNNKKLALLFLDLDGFKLINDTLGHQVGDELLKQVAERIECCIRDSDTVARIGGDEFTIIVSNIEHDSDAARVADEVVRCLLPPFRIDGKEMNITTSVGITIYPDDANDVESMLQNADQAMYAAKKEGKNQYGFFTKLMHHTSQARMQISQDIRRALGTGEFQVYFQPIVDLNTGISSKAEALLRWIHPERGFISPETFIPIAEETGTIGELGNWVFEQTVAFIAELRNKYQFDIKISVNLSPAQFVNFNTLDSLWKEILERYDVSGDTIVVEITEGILLSAEKSITDKLLRLRNMGIEIAIDDFGTGYSSLSYLKKLDVDYLKIDRSFVQNLGSDADDLVLSEAIIVMAQKLGLKVIAEGVETKAQRNILAFIGCNYNQGYLYSKPVPAKEFIQYLQLTFRSLKTLIISIYIVDI